MRRLLITGAKGQLGIDLVAHFRDSYDIVAADRNDLDVSCWPDVHAFVQRTRPCVIVHTAAYTQVDKAEECVAEAFRTNAIGTRNVARAGELASAKVIYISTDYVFDGSKPTPYTEFDPPNPLSVYGKSKLAGEEFVRTLSRNHAIVRTSWLYGANGRNFVRSILKRAMAGEPLAVVNDQHGSPTWTVELAKQIEVMIDSDVCGTVHCSSAGCCSWFDFASFLLEQYKIEVEIKAIQTSELLLPAPRPLNSCLRNWILELDGLDIMRSWDTAFAEFACTHSAEGMIS